MGQELLVAALLIGAATFRAWRIVGRDQIGDPVRVFLINRQGRFWEFVGDLFGCCWCLGWWLAGAATIVALWGRPWLEVGIVWAAASAVAGLLGEIDGRLTGQT